MFQLEAHLIILDILSVVKCLIYISHVQSHLIPHNLCRFSFSFLSVQWSLPLAIEGHQHVGFRTHLALPNLAVQGMPYHLPPWPPCCKHREPASFQRARPFPLPWFIVCLAGSLSISGPAHHHLPLWSLEPRSLTDRITSSSVPLIGLWFLRLL